MGRVNNVLPCVIKRRSPLAMMSCKTYFIEREERKQTIILFSHFGGHWEIIFVTKPVQNADLQLTFCPLNFTYSVVQYW